VNPEVRAFFPGASEQPYFDISANSLMAEPARAAIERHLAGRMSRRRDKTELVPTANRARARSTYANRTATAAKPASSPDIPPTKSGVRINLLHGKH